MIIIYVLLIITVVFFSYIFFAPFYIEINSEKEIYRIKLFGLLSLRVLAINNKLILGLNIIGIRKNIDLFAVVSNSIEKSAKKSHDVNLKTTAKKTGISWGKIKAIFLSFKIKKCNVTFDTGDAALNGILFPIFYFASFYSGKNISINFEERNEINLVIKNSFARIVWAYIRN